MDQRGTVSLARLWQRDPGGGVVIVVHHIIVLADELDALR